MKRCQVSGVGRRASRGAEPSCWAIVADLHVGCQVGLCPPGGARMDDGGRYSPNRLQRTLYRYWREFWDEFVPDVCHGRPCGVIVNGDPLDNVHHGSVSQWTHNVQAQRAAAYELLEPVVRQARGWFYGIRGTEAHGGKSDQDEEELYRDLGAIPDREGRHGRWELWKWARGPRARALMHVAHHVGTTSSSAYESTAVFKEQIEHFVEAARWGEHPPEWVVRSHRHRHLRVEIATGFGQRRANVLVTPGWQGKTPFSHRIAGARMAPPQWGGVVIIADKEEVYSRHYVRSPIRSRPE